MLDLRHTLSPNEASVLINKELSPAQIRLALQKKAAPYGYAYQGDGGRWAYVIFAKKFCDCFALPINIISRQPQL